MEKLSEKDGIWNRLSKLMLKLEAEGKMPSPVWDKASLFVEKLDTPTGLDEVLVEAKAFLDRHHA